MLSSAASEPLATPNLLSENDSEDPRISSTTYRRRDQLVFRLPLCSKLLQSGRSKSPSSVRNERYVGNGLAAAFAARRLVPREEDHITVRGAGATGLNQVRYSVDTGNVVGRVRR